MALVKQTLTDNETLEKSKLTVEEQTIYDDIMSHGLQNKFDEQLTEMKTSHIAKASICEQYRDELNAMPHYFEMPLYRNFIEDGMSSSEAKVLAESMVADDYEMANKKYNIVYDIGEKFIPQEEAFRLNNKVIRDPVGTTYYADADNGSDSNSGLSTGSAWRYLDKFAESSRSAGDILILRGGMNYHYDNNSTVSTVSDGSPLARIIVSADYGNAFGDHTSIGGVTATLIHGSKTISCTSSVSFGLSAGDIIYISGDDNLRFSYEIDTVVTSTITLFLPYKGDNEGSGKTLQRMGKPPTWTSSGANIRISHTSDKYWWWRGVKFVSNQSSNYYGVFELSSSTTGLLLTDLIFYASTGGNTNEYAIYLRSSQSFASLIQKCRILNFRRGIQFYYGAGSIANTTIKDCLIDGGTQSYAYGLFFSSSGAKVIETEIKDNYYGVYIAGYSTNVSLRNCIFTSNNWPYLIGSTAGTNLIISEYNQDKDDHRVIDGHDTISFIRSRGSFTTITRQNDDGVGSDYSIKVEGYDTLDGTADDPVTGTTVFEYPIKHDTDEFTVDVWMRTQQLGDWITNPTNTELYIELSYRTHATNMSRYDLRSTGTINMNGSTAWQKLSVVATPGQSGIAYLKLYYGKKKEDVDHFYVDPRPEIYKN